MKLLQWMMRIIIMTRMNDLDYNTPRKWNEQL